LPNLIEEQEKALASVVGGDGCDELVVHLTDDRQLAEEAHVELVRVLRNKPVDRTALSFCLFDSFSAELLCKFSAITHPSPAKLGILRAVFKQDLCLQTGKVCAYQHDKNLPVVSL
jgi:hypothetical protein